jgi:hypothetical protein
VAFFGRLDRMRTRVPVLVVLALLGRSDEALSQHWIFDAREIALGAVGREGNVSANMIEPERRYTSVVLPFGFFQIFRDPAIYDPDSKGFDPVRAVEYASTPFHYIVGRDTSDSAGAVFVSDIRHAILDRDLSKYQGFAPVSGRLAEAVTSSIGYIFQAPKADHRPSHGVYFGAGPYLSVETSGAIDPRLSSVLNGRGDVRNTDFAITDTDEAQVALALTAGYRARFPWPAGVARGSTRDGLYVGANYNYLRGLLYENDGLNIQLKTDSAGLLVDSSNMFVQHGHASVGTGFALDLGASAVLDRWELGVGANGVLNRIDWKGLNVTTYSLASLTSGKSDFIQTTTMVGIDRRVVLPVEYRGSVRYTPNDWTATMGVGYGFSGVGFHAGFERRLERLELRGGGHYRFSAWNPSGGFGFAFSPRISADVAVFGTNANVERKRQMGIAASVRVNRPAR